MVGWGLCDFLGGLYAKQIGPFRSFFWFQLAGLASALILAVAFTTTPRVTSFASLLLPIAAILYFAGYPFFFRGLGIGNISVVAATMNLWAVFTMLFAFIFLGQRLTTTQALGVLLILSAVTLASAN
jgi:drug/metabolite transporter (DMT)-like permease